MKRSEAGFTEDGILGNRVRLRQPVAGERAAIDPVVLAAAVPARPGETVLDVGAGSGVAALCLAARLPDVVVDALEIQPDLAELARENVELNGFAARMTVYDGDILDAGARLPRLPFDHLMTNPPFLEPGEGTESPEQGRRRAHVHGEADLARWIRGCLGLVRQGGTLTLVHRADRIDAILAALHGRAGGVIVFPLWPHAGKPARRVIVQARKGLAAPAVLHPGLALHDPAGGYSDDAEQVLRHAAAISL
ncbi:MAG TPA: methyltransferase [Alphaproteobacteria bacterium]|nr:methyltransferase [Alphaproteobacteria bacterium]